MAKKKVHGSKGAYVGGDWVPIEECDKLFNIENGSDKCDRNCGACPRSRTRHISKRSDGRYDVIIVGAGCIGGAIARELSKTNASVLVLEAADDVTQGATKGNSGIVHAGYDDKPGSVRAKYCWPGNQMFPQLDRELHFGFQQNGSLVVAFTPKDEEILEELMERGRKNGVANIRIIDQEELREKEPHINPRATKALYSPDAGTITPYEYTIALCENAADNGVEFRIRREVTGIEQTDNGFKLTAKHWEPEPIGGSFSLTSFLAFAAGFAALGAAIQFSSSMSIPVAAFMHLILQAGAYFAYKALNKGSSSSGLSNIFNPSPGTFLKGTYEEETYECDFLVNAAGCGADKVANLIGDDSFKILPRCGDYILLHKNQGHFCNHTLFPAPHPTLGKGVLAQTTLWGNLILGPTARDRMWKNPETGEYEINPKVRDQPREEIWKYILSKVRKLIPEFDARQVIHTFAGDRAKSTRKDWIIEPCPVAPKFIYACGIDSPGIAGSPAIAVDVVKLLQDAGLKLEMDPTFNPNRAPLIVPKFGMKGLKFGPEGKYKDPKTAVVCKCEKVTEQEIIDACRRSLPVDSTQAMRKRTRAGMGHCQGDPDNYNCEMRVAKIIARETGQPLNMIGRRPWPASSLLTKRWMDDGDRDALDACSHEPVQYE